MSGVRQSGSYATPRLDIRDAVMEADTDIQMIGPEVLPLTPVDEESANYPAITAASILGNPDQEVTAIGEGAGYPRDGFETKDIAYATKEYGSEKLIPDRTLRRYQSDFDAKTIAGKILRRRIEAAMEQRIADTVFNTTTFTGSAYFTDNSSGAPWSTLSTDILAQLEAAVYKVWENSSYDANALIISKDNVRYLRQNDDIRADLRYTGDGPLVPFESVRKKLEEYFGIRVIVGNVVKNTAKKGQAVTGSRVWSPLYAMVARVATADMASAGLGRTFIWNQDSAVPYTMEEYREEQSRGDVLRARHNTDEKIVDVRFGHLIKIRAA